MERRPQAPENFVECSWVCTAAGSCQPHCSRRSQQRGVSHLLQVFYTDNKGWCLRTRSFIATGEFIMEYDHRARLHTHHWDHRYPHKGFYAKRDIQPNEELTYMREGTHVKGSQFNCHCGHEECTGML